MHLKVVSQSQKRAAMVAWAVSTGISLLPSSVMAETANGVISAQTKTVENAQESQKSVDKMAYQTSRMLEEYKLVLRQTESLKAYNDQVERLVESQESEKGSLTTQISEIELTSREVVPMMSDMLATLEQFVGLDVPFLPEERQNRVKTLRAELDRADISTSEKFRRIMEAYQVESEYGRTIEAYRGDIEGEGGNKITVDFLKIGRIALMYQTLDGKVSKAWDQKSKSWLALDQRFTRPIQDGLKIARKQSAPDLLTLPIPTPEATL